MNTAKLKYLYWKFCTWLRKADEQAEKSCIQKLDFINRHLAIGADPMAAAALKSLEVWRFLEANPGISSKRELPSHMWESVKYIPSNCHMCLMFRASNVVATSNACVNCPLYKAGNGCNAEETEGTKEDLWGVWADAEEIYENTRNMIEGEDYDEGYLYGEYFADYDFYSPAQIRIWASRKIIKILEDYVETRLNRSNPKDQSHNRAG